MVCIFLGRLSYRSCGRGGQADKCYVRPLLMSTDVCGNMINYFETPCASHLLRPLGIGCFLPPPFLHSLSKLSAVSTLVYAIHNRKMKQTLHVLFHFIIIIITITRIWKPLLGWIDSKVRSDFSSQ